MFVLVVFVLQRKSVPRASVTGCIYNFKFYNELVGEPLTKAGISPCFDSKMESGVFFSGEGAYMASRECVFFLHLVHWRTNQLSTVK